MGWQATVAGGTAAGVTEAGGAVAGVTEATPRSVDDAVEDLPPALRNAYRSYGLAGVCARRSNSGEVVCATSVLAVVVLGGLAIGRARYAAMMSSPEL